MQFRTTVLCTFAALALPLQAHAQAEPIVIKVAHLLPAMAPIHTKVIAPWCDKLAAESQGRLKCQIYPAMQLGGTPPQLLSQVRDGVADIVYTLPGYTPGRFPTSEVFELPFVTTNHEASARAMWDFVQSHSAKEFAGLKPLAVWVNGPNVLHTRDRQVNTLDDLKGLKVRAPSRLGNKLLAALGATPVGMPVPQMAESLSKGVIDGTLVPWEVVPATKTHELTQFHGEPGGARTLTTATMIYVMNQKKYDSLPPDLQKVIDDNSGREFSAWVAVQHAEADTVGRKLATDARNTVYTIPADEMARWQTAARPVTDEWIKETSAKGADGQKLYEDAVALVDKYSR
ncbi:C4-dicarboxylate ABC transporter [Thauera humireducens]|jgi:TRAP-type C4-dicarboxylate transport system substrate-binding protein|uniref:C4-dicarboxylate ABC transporter n=2 Tax=Thauera TaxID=33057 RepID=A0A235EXB9_9RHOO|nr:MULTISPECIES: TRAP transporter substrate-binding protein [Thauera]AMO36881.1 C4-dicarboxylate ABC transporter [Thauera humireducens]ENO77168.1 putative C4-dicarboxylate-binding periplasmic protein [Thauera sp. 63]OYD53631.1 C4-dicarboxylate ABC transporter [Thauera propionica]CAH1749275.1 C4-dicarboxylate ABC transporter [Thauera humireducens]